MRCVRTSLAVGRDSVVYSAWQRWGLQKQIGCRSGLPGVTGDNFNHYGHCREMNTKWVKLWCSKSPTKLWELISEQNLGSQLNGAGVQFQGRLSRLKREERPQLLSEQSRFCGPGSAVIGWVLFWVWSQPSGWSWIVLTGMHRMLRLPLWSLILHWANLGLFPWQSPKSREEAEVHSIFWSIGVEMVHHFLFCILSSKENHTASLSSRVLEMDSAS